jgi:hypothetical protein
MPAVNQFQRQQINLRFGIGLALFIVAYFVATVCFIIFE